MIDSKKGLLQRLFNIYPGEGRRVFIFSFLGFLWAFGATCGLKFADALFLIHLGADSLPTAYMAISCGMMGIACFLVYAYHRLTSYQIYLTTLSVGLVFYAFVYGCRLFEIGTDSDWFWYLLKLMGFFLFAILMTCYWTFIDQYYHMQDAKRLYSLFSSTIFLGATSTGLVMNSGSLDLSHLACLIFFLYAVTLVWVCYIARRFPLETSDIEATEVHIEDESNSVKELLLSIIRSPFTLLVMCCNFTVFLLLVITEANYQATFEQHFENLNQVQPFAEGTDAQLTIFLGQCLASVSACNLFFGLFIYSRLVKRFGISFLVMITPVLLMTAFVGWSISTSLIFPLIGFFVVEGTLYVIDDSNFNLLLNAVPSKMKYKIRAMIESFFEPIGMLVSSGLMAFFQEQSKILGFILAACLFGMAFILRSSYLKALLFNLSENDIHFKRQSHEWLSCIPSSQIKQEKEKFIQFLNSKDEREQLLAYECLMAFQDDSLLSIMCQKSEHFSSFLKIQCLGLLESSCFNHHPLIIKTIQQWHTQDCSPYLKGMSHFYLAKVSHFPIHEAEKDLASADSFLRGSALISLHKSLPDLSPEKKLERIQLLDNILDKLLNSSIDEEKAIGYEVLGIIKAEAADSLISYLDHSSFILTQAAAKALTYTKKLKLDQLLKIIHKLPRLKDFKTRLWCLKLIKQVTDPSIIEALIANSLHLSPFEKREVELAIYQIGASAIPSVFAIFTNRQLALEIRLIAGKVLGLLDLDRLKMHLLKTIDHEMDQAYFYFYSYNQLSTLDLPIESQDLEEVLKANYQLNIDFIIQILAVTGKIEETELLAKCLRSSSLKTRSQVVETLEKICHSSIFKRIQPLIDEIPYLEKIRPYLLKHSSSISLETILSHLEHSHCQMNIMIAERTRQQINQSNFNFKQIEPLTTLIKIHQNPNVFVET